MAITVGMAKTIVASGATLTANARAQIESKLDYHRQKHTELSMNLYRTNKSMVMIIAVLEKDLQLKKGDHDATIKCQKGRW
mgnify:CR=1 FL=1